MQVFAVKIGFLPAKHQFACQKLEDVMKSRDNCWKLQACERLPLPIAYELCTLL